MLTCGCGDTICEFKLCKSCSTSQKVDLQMASAVAVCLASRPALMLCPTVQAMKKEDIVGCISHALNNHPVSAASTEKNISSFLSRMMSFTSLSHIFNPSLESFSLKKSSFESLRSHQSSFSQNDLRNLMEIKLPIDKTLSKIQDSALNIKPNIPDYFNNSDWKQLVSEYKKSGNTLQLVDCLNTIYSSRTRLGRSFLMDITSKSSALDLNALEYFYEKVYELV